jgi:L-asparagine transporter-like permease
MGLLDRSAICESPHLIVLHQAIKEIFMPQNVFAPFALLPMLIGIATWIMILISIWRAMKAHESIAESLRQIAQKDQKM